MHVLINSVKIMAVVLIKEKNGKSNNMNVSVTDHLQVKLLFKITLPTGTSTKWDGERTVLPGTVLPGIKN